LKKLEVGLAAVVLFLSLAGAARSQSPSFPMNHWVYDFLERMEVRGLVRPIFNGTRPLSRDEIAGCLDEILSNPSKYERLNSVEKQQLTHLTLELREYLPRNLAVRIQNEAPRLMNIRRWGWIGKIFPNSLYTNGRNLFSYSEDNFSAVLDPVLYWKGFTARADTGSHRDFRESHGVTAWGRWGNHLAFFFDFRDSKIWGNYAFPVNGSFSLPGTGYAESFGSYAYFDETQAGLIVGGNHWQITLGKERNAWGPGHWGNLALSANPTSYDQVKLQLRFRKFKFTSIAGILRPYPDLVEYSYFTGHFQRNIWAHKYMAAHRLEAAPFRFLKLGLQEVLIYGERNPELAYLNPVNFYWSAEHNLGDQDNSTLGATVEIFPGFSSKFYGEIFLDDLKTSRLGTGWYGNKWAVLAGLFRADVLGVPNLDFRAELAKIRPYVYTHRYPINVYEHFVTPLGHWAGPNSETVNAALTWRPSRWMRTGLEFQYWKHGANPDDQNVGGNINLCHRAFDATEVHFFEGEVENRTQARLFCSYEWFRNFATRFEILWTNEKNVPLNSGGRGNVKSVGGFFSAGLNF